MLRMIAVRGHKGFLPQRVDTVYGPNNCFAPAHVLPVGKIGRIGLKLLVYPFDEFEGIVRAELAFEDAVSNRYRFLECPVGNIVRIRARPFVLIFYDGSRFDIWK